MKLSPNNKPSIPASLVAAIVRQLGELPECDLTVERVASTFADRLEANFTNFDRAQFLHDTGVSERMIEDAETKTL